MAGTSVPGLTIQYSTDNGDSWQDYESGVQIPSDTEVRLRARYIISLVVTLTGEGNILSNYSYM